MTRKTSIVLLAVFLLGWAAPAGQAKEVEGVVVEQQSDFYGPQTAYITRESICIVAPRLGITLITRAPEWRVTGVNLKGKTYIDVTQDEWWEKFLGAYGVRRRRADERLVAAGLREGIPPCGAQLGPVRVGARREIAGREAVQFLIFDPMTCELAPPRAVNIEVWATRQMKLPGNMPRIFAALCSISYGFGVPLEVNRFLPSGQTLRILRTSKVEERSFSDSVFEVPQDYVKVEDEMSLIIDSPLDGSAQAQQDLDEIFGQGSPLDELARSKPEALGALPRTGPRNGIAPPVPAKARPTDKRSASGP